MIFISIREALCACALQPELAKSYPILQSPPSFLAHLSVESSCPPLTASNAKLAQLETTSGASSLLLTGRSTSTSAKEVTKDVREDVAAVLLLLSTGLESGFGFLQKVGDTVVVFSVVLAVVLAVILAVVLAVVALAVALAVALSFAFAVVVAVVGSVGGSALGCVGEGSTSAGEIGSIWGRMLVWEQSVEGEGGNLLPA
jgi:hypothetical protein